MFMARRDQVRQSVETRAWHENPASAQSKQDDMHPSQHTVNPCLFWATCCYMSCSGYAQSVRSSGERSARRHGSRRSSHCCRAPARVRTGSDKRSYTGAVARWPRCPFHEDIVNAFELPCCGKSSSREPALATRITRTDNKAPVATGRAGTA